MYNNVDSPLDSGCVCATIPASEIPTILILSAAKTKKASKKPVKNQAPVITPKMVVLIKEGVFYFLIALVIYLFVCLASFSPNDPGWSHTVSSQGGFVNNWGGRFGALLADVLLHGFGKMAYLFPLLVLIAAWKIYQSREQVAISLQQKIFTYAGFVLILLGGCGLENLHSTGPGIISWIPGGVLGNVSADFARPMFGYIGASIFLLALLLMGMSWFSGISWMTVMDTLGRWLCNAYDYCVLKVQGFFDRKAGEKAREKREVSVKEKRQKLETKTPPKIEPKVVTPKISERVEREKQVSLFSKQAPSGSIPPLSLLDKPSEKQTGFSVESLEAMSRLLEKKLLDFNIEIQVVEVHPGPVITRFEIDPAPGVKASQITNLANDIARALSLVSIRVVENIPGKSVIGIEIPNEIREIVNIMDVLSSEAYEDTASPLALVLGKDISGEPVVVDLAKMPHLLIAGTTGSGKSVCVNALILSLLYKATPEQVRLIMVDPKMLELSIYEGIPHLLSPVVTDMEKAANALRWAIFEMDRRYKLMSALGVRNIPGYNRKVKTAMEKGEPILDPLADEGDDAQELRTLPYIVIVIDELADLMMVVGKKIEELITRIAQKARAAGIHLILATQRPSVDVITGLIKANVPSRIAFQVSSRVDSRTVLDQMGAEQLLGHGDMLYLAPGTALPVRVHGSFVADSEVHSVVKYLTEHGNADYDESVLSVSRVDGEKPVAGADSGAGGEEDPLYDEAVRFVTERQMASISSVQRQFRVGYNRAARLIETMEESGVIGPPESGGKRQVLVAAPPEV